MANLWASETTVTLPPVPGRGGRCRSLALAAALEIRDGAHACVLATGIDGTDGPGAIVDAGTVARGLAAGLDPERCLHAANAGTFLEASGDLLHTDSTGTNVVDLVVTLKVAPRQRSPGTLP